MSDARWVDVEDDVQQAVRHFRNARALYAARKASDDALDEYRDSMALMHALQSAHTSAEAAMHVCCVFSPRNRQRARIGTRS